MSNFDLSNIVAITPPRKPSEKLTWLVYAPPGTGKTLLAGSASEVEAMSPVLLIDIEGGSSTLSHKYPGVQVAKVDDWKTCAALIEALCANETEYRTVIVDSIHAMQTLILEWAESTGNGNGFEKWAHAFEKTRMAITSLHKSDYHVICTSQAERDQDEFSRERLIRPHFQGKKSAVELPSIFDQIAYLFIQEDEKGNKRRVMQLEQDPNVQTKNRAGDLLPDYLVDANFSKIHDLLTAE